MKIFSVFAFLLATTLLRAPGADSLTPFEKQAPSEEPATSDQSIDGIVFGKLKREGIQPANPCSESTFLRRVYLDVIGTLPTAEEAKAFLADKNPKKRAALIDRLLERDEFADYWGMKWCDLLRVKAEFPVNLWPNAAQAYDRWIRNSIKENKPYSRFVWEMLTANGSNFRSPPVNFYRSAGSKDPKALARTVALTFMGERADKWPAAKLDAMAAFFSQIGFKATGEWKEEIIFPKGIDGGRPMTEATLPDGTSVQLANGQDPREPFAVWLTSAKTSPLARAAVNRVWFWLMGRGIVQEPDDIRPDNPPSNPDLLSWLAEEFVSTTYDIKYLYRMILNSRTYQLSCIRASTQPDADAQFAFYPVRRVDAEVLIDALNQITGTTEEYYSMIPEPFTWVPDDKRSIALPDGSISSAFLELFGRPPRDTGLLVERNNKTTAGQALHLLNSTHVQSKLSKSPKLNALLSSNLSPQDTVCQIYLTFLSRYPTTKELEIISEYTGAGGKGDYQRRQMASDLMWALFNSSEFLYRH